MENANYETFYEEMQQTEKKLKEKLAQAQKSFKGIVRDSETGDVKKLSKDIEEMRDYLAELMDLSGELQNKTNAFDAREYFMSGEFTRQMVAYCKQYAVDIQGEAGVYEMFPFKVRVDAENQDLYVNRRKVPCMRPNYFVQDMKKQVEKYTKSSFNISRFVNELAAAYDLAVVVKDSARQAAKKDPDIILKDIYPYLAPTARARQEYDLQQYAFDLSKLYAADENTLTKDGRRYQFGPIKQAGKLIRILDGEGKEQFLGTIRFFEA